MKILGRVRRMELKWFVIGLLLGLAAGYLQGAGQMDVLALIPV